MSCSVAYITNNGSIVHVTDTVSQWRTVHTAAFVLPSLVHGQMTRVARTSSLARTESAFRSAGCATGMTTAGTTPTRETVRTRHALPTRNSTARKISASRRDGAATATWTVQTARTKRCVVSAARR
jgi:hypothetical protein